MFRKSLIFVFLLVLPLLSTLAYSSEFVYADFGSKIYFLEVAQDAVARSQGLSGRSCLESNAGMLFVFNNPGNYAFVMREMKFPLDFVWLRDGIVVDLTANVPVPNSLADSLESILPSQAINNVIELNAGEIQKSGIKVGSPIRFYKNSPQG
jgi:uncharacterized membrane protein (UPF0127 family)